MDSCYFKHLIKSMEDRAKEEYWAAAGVPILYRFVWYVPTTNAITLAHCIVKDQLVHGYSVYQYLMGAVDATTVGWYRK